MVFLWAAYKDLPVLQDLPSRVSPGRSTLEGAQEGLPEISGPYFPNKKMWQGITATETLWLEKLHNYWTIFRWALANRDKLELIDYLTTVS
jgi:hypothetical protein